MCKQRVPGAGLHRILGPALILTVVLTASLVSMAAHAATPIKWIDEHGVVHYGDRASAEGGVRSAPPRDTKAAAATVQVSTAGGRTAEVPQAVPVPPDQRRKDRVLLDSYSSATEIDRARERATSSIQGELDAAQRTLAQLRTRRAEFEKSKPRGAKPIAAAQSELAQVDDLVTYELRFISLKTDQLEKTAARYDADRRRWQEINGELASR